MGARVSGASTRNGGALAVKGPLLLLSAVQANPEGHLDDVQLGRILATLRRYPNVPLDVLIREHQEQRSLDQNSYMHAEPFPKVAGFMGGTIEEAKYTLMGECWGWKFSPLAGREVPVKPSTSSMTVKECTYFIEWMPPWAFEHCNGLTILLPNEWEAAGSPQYIE